MTLETVADIQTIIKETHGVDPIETSDNFLKYRAITFSKNKGSAILSNKSMGELWQVCREGHSIDYYRTEELTKAICMAGALPYFFVSL